MIKQAAQSSGGDLISRAHHTVRYSEQIERLVHFFRSGFHGDRRHKISLSQFGKTGIPDSLFISAQTLPSGSRILKLDTQEHQSAPLLLKHFPRQVIGRPAIIIIYTWVAFRMLSDHHDRNRQISDLFSVFRSDHSADEDHPVCPLVEFIQIIWLFFRFISCHRQEHSVIVLLKLHMYAIYDLSYMIKRHFRSDHPGELCFPGTQCLCLHGRMISCFLDHFANGFFFRLGYIAVIKISRNCSAGYTCQLCYFRYIHSFSPYFPQRNMIYSLPSHFR